MIYTIDEKGNRILLPNIKDLKSGQNVIVEGLAVNQLQFVRQWEITQMRKPDDDPSAEAREVQVPQWHFSLGGRSFTITGNGLASDGEALTATVKKTAKGGDRVKEVYLVANEWHPQLTDAQGNLIYEDEAQTIPAMNMEVTNQSFTYSGQASAAQVAEEQDDQISYETKKANINAVGEKQLESLFNKFLAKNAQEA